MITKGNEREVDGGEARGRQEGKRRDKNIYIYINSRGRAKKITLTEDYMERNNSQIPSEINELRSNYAITRW